MLTISYLAFTVTSCFAACQLSFSFCKQKGEKRNDDFLDDEKLPVQCNETSEKHQDTLLTSSIPDSTRGIFPSKGHEILFSINRSSPASL